MRYSRLLIGLTVIVVAIWVIVGEQITGASADAVVNARLSTVRAPINGRLEMPDRELGTAIREGEELASLTDPLVDRISLDDLEMERAFEQAAVAKLRAIIAATEAAIPPLDRRAARLQADRAAQAEHQLTVSAPTSRTPEELGSEMRTVQDGGFSDDGYNGAPLSEQWRTELALRRDEQAAELAEAQTRLAAVDSQINRAQLAANALTSGPLTSTVNGQLWEILASDGKSVQRGQDVLRLLDCDSAIVTLSVSEGIYHRLRVGQEASFRLASTGDSYSGTVTRLAGTGAETIYQNLAIAPSERHLKRYDVALLVPALRDVPELRCAIGQTGRVYFDTRPLDWLRGFGR